MNEKDQAGDEDVVGALPPRCTGACGGAAEDVDEAAAVGCWALAGKGHTLVAAWAAFGAKASFQLLLLLLLLMGA